MCLGIPMRVKKVEGLIAWCEARGIERQASLLMFQHEEVKEGDHVMIHLGQVIQKLAKEEAEQSWKLYDEIFAQLDQAER